MAFIAHEIEPGIVDGDEDVIANTGNAEAYGAASKQFIEPFPEPNSLSGWNADIGLLASFVIAFVT